MSPLEAEPQTEDQIRPPRHSWLMIACCIPMLLIAVALVATGVVGPGFIVVALACTAMMAMMMRAMDGGDSQRS